jgi:hypothetical protein
MIPEEASDRVDLACSAIVVESKEDNSSVWASLPEHQLAKVFVIRDQDAIVSDGHSQEIFVESASRLVVDRDHVVMVLAKPARDRGPR